MVSTIDSEIPKHKNLLVVVRRKDNTKRNGKIKFRKITRGDNYYSERFPKISIVER